ncbi:hypothetical protein, partial [Bacillus smithii]|uniref:hypothetical protein n=1 Tax=Bacillus smithii TaxID=1479 RepID=UPI002E1F7128|nr:hypothetical protein [Bacillus smithii]MED1457297.1 hypothetical protein [Bacillus smithii]
RICRQSEAKRSLCFFQLGRINLLPSGYGGTDPVFEKSRDYCRKTKKWKLSGGAVLMEMVLLSCRNCLALIFSESVQ